ncbi:type II toxin-antitoxin system death-on-curing family toxin [Persephonella sp. IF05-L8]|uniref:type II toxin-antitoxin system death-on-curing family toxin n=1 Tax=Persephonella sp. IF05-L8 TaxID=1158338 RepID=UPI0004958D89
MFPVDLVNKIHNRIISETGGSYGVRDINLLKSALEIPFQTFEGKELYPSIEEKAAKLLETLIKNHPFVDGNKRTAYVLFTLYLELNGFYIKAEEDEKFKFVMKIAESKYSFKEILEWIKANTNKQNGKI